MPATITREIKIAKPPEDVWDAIASREHLAEWMYPNNFEPRVGHVFTFKVPGTNEELGFDGVVHCEVVECSPPKILAYTWGGGAVQGTQVSYRLEPDGGGTRIYFEHSGFDDTQPWSQQAIGGAEYGWNMMLGALADIFKEN